MSNSVNAVGAGNGGFDIGAGKRFASEKALAKATKNLVAAEEKFAKVAGDPNATEAQVIRAESKMKAAARVLEAASRAAQMMHEMVMSVLRNLRN